LGYLGENVIQDLLTYDTAGNLVSYRARVFDSEADANAATFDIPEASSLQAGELSRILVTIDIDIANNDRQSLIMTLDKLETPTPGVG
ncbi:MAG TPA: hypothetical protein VG457_15680, partial [Planctomycetota bacterium]|nr:hypothetical protein [Planctomycetota bacterium]